MRPFTILLRDKGAIARRGMSIEPIIDGVLAGQISAKASVCILSEFEDSDTIPMDESRWGPLSGLANLHWMATMSIPEEKLTFLKSLDGQRVPKRCEWE